MDGGNSGGRDKGSPPPKPTKFAVYQNPALSAALTTNSLRPPKSSLLCILSLSAASAFALLSIIAREKGFIDSLKLSFIPSHVAFWFGKALQTVLGFVFLGTMLALVKVISLQRATNAAGLTVISPSKGRKEQTVLTSRQLGLLGIRAKIEKAVTQPLKKPPKTKSNSSSPADVLVPLHPQITISNRSSQLGSGKSNTSSGSKTYTFSTPSKPSGSTFPLYLVPAAASQLPSSQTSPGFDQLVTTPWSNKRASNAREIATEEDLEQFLVDVGEKISESAGRLATPPPTLRGFSLASPITVTTSANSSGTTRSTPLRPVRMSPGSQKFTPPKKGEGELPSPMSMEESIEAFENVGIYPQVEQWRDRLRQWFSLVLLNPLLSKIDTSHMQVMQAATKLGISITIGKVGSNLPTTGTRATVSSVERPDEWQPATLDEDSLLHQLRATLVQALDASTSKLPLGNMQQSPQQNPMIPIIQECIDATTEHQRLRALMKGEWAKGLLPQSSVRADYTVQRIRELAEGTCLKNYEYLGSGEVYDKVNKKWTLELPTDSHLLLYLFCAFLEHPKWMLHVDPTSYAGAQSSKNPLFAGVLPPKERFPEKYVAVISGAPYVLHPGACVLAVGRQSPPIFALYWDKKPQLSFQGRTALWDSILLLCHRINVACGGVVRGMHLGSSALGILPVLDPETEE
ncbi:uncharacterized protein LOC131335968 [Rhododendron vialii]|uniref:uncharacterized protein LOC131335968 n=1 Tax=Rhododendron vialii TaxID=182163 RepID=UPI00265E71BA|nr:uncharacterized protein LOC131335968 [Rhododendron vialii]